MNRQLIAIAVDNKGVISNHGGRALNWQVFSIENGEPLHVWNLQLTDIGCLHEWHVRGDGNRHPLHGIDIVIAASAGKGVAQRLAERGVTLLTTITASPLEALNQYLSNKLPSGIPHGQTACAEH